MGFDNWMRWVVKGGALIGLCAAIPAIGCGGIGPGDYVIYRIALSEPSLSGDCSSDSEDSSTFRDSQTFILYAGPNEKFYLDAGQGTLEGSATDEGFKFSGKSVDVDDVPDQKQTTTTDVSVTVTVDGAAVSGTVTTKQTVTCTGTNCGGAGNFSCTQTSKFVGSEIHDVALEHDPG
jgi:hypothetical protein